MTHTISVFTSLDWETDARITRDNPARSARNGRKNKPASEIGGEDHCPDISCEVAYSPQVRTNANALTLAWAARLITSCCSVKRPYDCMGRFLA
jgi:hypothetical protein